MPKEFKIEYAIFTKRPDFYYKKTEFNGHIVANTDLLLNLFDVARAGIVSDFERRKKESAEKKTAFDNKTCLFCGAEMRFVTGYGFWGCPNYKDGGQHSTYRDYQHYEEKIKVDKNWLTGILDSAQLRGKIKAKELLAFYHESGKHDLRVEFGFEPTDKMINTLQEVKKRSTEQETAAFELLSRKFHKVTKQQTITYRMQGEEEKFCIPDFICGSLESVFVCDAKLDYPDDDKMDMYVALVKFIMGKHADSRTVIGSHIMYVQNIDGFIRKSRHQLFALVQKKNAE